MFHQPQTLESEGDMVRARDVQGAEHRAEILEARQLFQAFAKMVVGIVSVLRARIPEHHGLATIEGDF